MPEIDRSLVVGSGGREYVLTKRLLGANRQVIVAPGNAGTGRLLGATNRDISVKDIDGILRTANDEQVKRIVVGPEAPLELGLVNAALEAGLPIFGPTKEGAQLETSKAWAVEFMRRHGIPHGATKIFADFSKAGEYLDHVGWKDVVVKADGLAAGKGVIVPDSEEEAHNALKRMMVDKEFGDAGKTVLIQERLYGPEVSIFVFTDGITAVPMLPAQDYKRLLDGNKGPNTGGMGSFAPSPLVNGELFSQIHKDITIPTVTGLSEEGIKYVGIIYLGLILTSDGPKMIEYNVRFGDPEIQSLLPTFSRPLGATIDHCINGTLDPKHVAHHPDLQGVSVVVASEGYPDNPQTGVPILGLDSIKDPSVTIDHAGTSEDEHGEIVTSGGRVLAVSATAETREKAAEKAYSAIGKGGVHFEGMQYRKDIGTIYEA